MKKKLSRKEIRELWSQLRNEDEIFDDLCDARDEVVRVIAHQDMIKRALVTELEKWDIKVDAMFQKKIDKEIKSKIEEN